MPDWWNVLVAMGAPAVFLASGVIAGHYLEREGQKERARAAQRADARKQATRSAGSDAEEPTPQYVRDVLEAFDRASNTQH